MTENEIAIKVMGLAIAVHKSLGSVLLESTYEERCNVKKWDKKSGK